MIDRQTNGERLREHLQSHGWIGEGNSHAGFARTALAVCLILFGTALFLSNLGLFPIRAVWDYWPLLLIGFGVIRGLGRPSPSALVWAAFLIFAGIVIFLLNTGAIHVRAGDDSWPLSLLVIAFGVLMLVKALSPRSSGPSFLNRFAAGRRSSSASALSDWAVFGSIKRRLETPDFQGGQAVSIFGNVEVDLRRAQMAGLERTIMVDATSIFGAVKLRIPENWRPNMQGIGVLGSFEDKTITAAMPQFDAPVLVVTGLAIFGAVEIEN